ncbi:DUF4337 family protein [Camelimonas sp. ID_303_24]
MARLAEQTADELKSENEALEAARDSGKPPLLEDPLVTRVSVTMAILAVTGVILGSIESMQSAASSAAASQALIHQNKATDAWSALDARMVRQALGRTGDAQARFNDRDDEALAAHARAQENLSLASLREAERRGDRHEILTWAVMLVQIAIAIATISIIARPRRWPWLAAMGLGAAGTLLGLGGWLA